VTETFPQCILTEKLQLAQMEEKQVVVVAVTKIIYLVDDNNL
jgi:hypothetical protein